MVANIIKYHSGGQNTILKMKIKCERGHIFLTSHKRIKWFNSWCNICNYRKKNISLEEINETIKHMNIKCISEKYENFTKKLKFLCQCGNEWDMHFNKVRK